MAVAEYFVLLYPYVYATGDLAEWNALSDPDCKFCASVVDNARAMSPTVTTAKAATSRSWRQGPRSNRAIATQWSCRR